MTAQQPTGWHLTATILDDDAPHQIRIHCSGTLIQWSCTCRRHRANRGGMWTFPPLGYIDGPVEAVLAEHADHVRRAA